MRQFTEKDAIKNLQTYLRALNFADRTYPEVTVDGIFDSKTKYALIEFQKRNGLNPTGIVDRKTWDMLYGQYLGIMHKNSLPGPIIPFPSYPDSYTVKRGEKSFLVSIVQYLLNEIGTVFNTFEPIAIDGEYGPETEKAVRLFQVTSALKPTGEVDRITWDALSHIYNISAHYIEQN